ncbi:S8 family serine peptidase [Jatrophihabitans endophyticus]|uniref:S8 family peptidase n=1 Tax=Jatrophihabitans endophyticus TaxID=1206085 RepID=UPI001A0FE132|nr:S8 family serine peptidase [Jatrophihabitans endophyticus]MBE7189093.1 S8 family serine peptidase [Jatrophihabitans endophyticus]
MTARRPVVAVVAALLALAAVVLSAPGTVAAAVPGPSTAPEYWFARWDVRGLWASGARGQGVTIAVIDTGVTASLPELSGRVLAGKDFGIAGNGQVDHEVNQFGHGTAMASIMVARPGLLGITGLAPAAKVLPIAVPLDGTTDAKRPDRLPAAIGWAADHGASIINLSIGGKQYPGRDAVPCSPAEQDAVFHALDRGAVVVAAVGNTGPHRNIVEDPGACLGVVTVGAVDRRGRVASFSSRQPYLSLVAPGVNIPSLGRKAGDAFAGDGTSQATALVSASLALAKSAHPKLSGPALVARLFATLDGRTARPSPSRGYGELDAGALVRAHVPPGARDPVARGAAPFYDRYRALTHPALPPVPPAGSRPADPVDAGDRATQADTELHHGLELVAAGLLLLVALLAAVAVRRRAAPPVIDPDGAAGRRTPAVRPRPGPPADGPRD